VSTNTKFFPKQLLKWHKSIDRKMPWKLTKDPYKIWLSEIILQQTRVQQGTPYYLKFIREFPTVHELAAATEDKVLSAWEGLGYYSRARNLHASAKIISQEFKGIFPDSYDEILKLNGVGPYTAAAIASFAFNQECAVVDGNVQRVIARVFGIEDPIDTNKGKKRIEQLASILIHKQQPAAYNQAIMDFGATLCKPKNPLCNGCPMQQVCYAFKENKVEVLPIKVKKIKKRTRFFHYLIIEEDEKVMLEKRGSGDIWQGLYEFPLMETSEAKLLNYKAIDKTIKKIGFKLKSEPIISKAFQQQLTHQKIVARFYTCMIENLEEKKEKILVDRNNLVNFAFPKIINCYLDDNSVYLI